MKTFWVRNVIFYFISVSACGKIFKVHTKYNKTKYNNNIMIFQI